MIMVMMMHTVVEHEVVVLCHRNFSTSLPFYHSQVHASLLFEIRCDKLLKRNSQDVVCECGEEVRR